MGAGRRVLAGAVPSKLVCKVRLAYARGEQEQEQEYAARTAGGGYQLPYKPPQNQGLYGQTLIFSHVWGSEVGDGLPTKPEPTREGITVYRGIVKGWGRGQKRGGILAILGDQSTESQNGTVSF